MERDPICGMTVDPLRAAAQVEYRRQRLFLLRQGLRRKIPHRSGSDARPRSRTPRCKGRRANSTSKRADVLGDLVDFGAQAQPASKASQPESNAIYICPMDPEVRQDHPGACPRCGMALETEVQLAPASRVEYTCPMHPEIVGPLPARARSAEWRSNSAPSHFGTR